MKNKEMIEKAGKNALKYRKQGLKRKTALSSTECFEGMITYPRQLL